MSFTSAKLSSDPLRPAQQTLAIDTSSRRAQLYVSLGDSESVIQYKKSQQTKTNNWGADMKKKQLAKKWSDV